MQNKEYPNDSEERKAVLTVLATTEPTLKSDCPSDQTLAAFIDKRLNAEQRSTVLDHLDACPDCYEKWLSAAEILADEKKTPVRFWKRPFFSVPLAVAAGLAVFIVLNYWPSGADKLLSDTYKTINEQNMTSSADSLILPWEQPSQSFGFASALRISASYRAFGAGLWQGKQELDKEAAGLAMPPFFTPSWNGKSRLKADKWSDTPVAIFFRMGRWCLALRAVCLSDAPVSEDFWERQIAIVELIREDLNELPYDVITDKEWIVAKMLKIQSGLNAIIQNNKGRRKYRQLAEEADALIDFMSPGSVL
ncbi:hypothetical protein QUF90_21965 [Desulfococcaceae bacterium HSG9]|nr:hypothetical protein [Desulfococcaceae bacterium HSG9]